MATIFPGLTVERAIPLEVVAGLLSGQYSLHGGVIRGAAGTAHAGQIIRHLIPITAAPLDSVPSLINTYQLYQLSGQTRHLTAATQQVLQLATGTMILSGLTLAATALGFVFLNQKLMKLDGQLTELQKEVGEIRNILERAERADLRAAIRDLLKLDDSMDAQHRHTILHNARRTLARINERYRELLAGASTAETALAYEEYFCLTALAQIRCTADLGMLRVAVREVEDMAAFWRGEMRRVANELLLRDHPERFLCSEFVAEVPAALLVEWLDFAYGEEKGYGWIDELRSRIDPWYPKQWFTLPDIHLDTSEFDKDRTLVIPALQKLVARSKVFEGHLAQYEFFATHNIKPLEFEAQVAALTPGDAVDGYVILNPTEASS